MNYEIHTVIEADKEALADLRVSAMRESLEHVGRFDPERAKARFLEGFVAVDTKKVLLNDELAGFYVLRKAEGHLYLAHLYFSLNSQNQGLGGEVLDQIKQQAKSENLPIRLGALRHSRSNDFYKKHGFKVTHEETWDIYYELRGD